MLLMHIRHRLSWTLSFLVVLQAEHSRPWTDVTPASFPSSTETAAAHTLQVFLQPVGTNCSDTTETRDVQQNCKRK